MVRVLIKEICGICNKPIKKGQSITECAKCSVAAHAKCLKKSDKYKYINDKQYCENCCNFIPKIYNPFRNLNGSSPSNQTSESFDRHYEHNIEDIFEELSLASSVLEHCKSLKSTSEFDRHVELKGIESTNFSTLFQNIDGNRSNFDNFAVHIHKIKHKFSVIGLAETNTDPSNKDLFNIDGYTSFYQDTKFGKSKGTGVALYIHNGLSAKKDEGLSQCSDNLESLFVKFNINNVEHSVGVVYNPPSGDRAKFNSELEEIVKKSTIKNVHIIGDFNLNLHKVECTITKTFEDIFLTNGLFPLISIATHARPGCDKSCIDNIFTSNVSDIISSGTIELGISHHHSIFQLSELVHGNEHKVSVTQYYDFSNSKTEQFLENIEAEFQECGHRINLQQFATIYDQKIDEFFKLDSPKTSKRNRKSNPWITEGLIISIGHKEVLYADWDDTRSKICPDGDQKVHQKYSDYRRSLKHTINAAKEKFYGTKFKQYKGNFKKTWEIINEIRGKQKSSCKSHFIIDNEKVSNRRVIANEFNKYFISLASTLNDAYNEGIEIRPITPFTEFLKTSNESSIFLEDCTINEIYDVINGLENNKASDIPVNIIKKSASIIAPVLAGTFNHCMKLGIFPESLKVGKITPIFKKGDAQLIENYRPVSTLPIFGKIFEKIIYERLYSFFVSQNIMNPHQFGFRKGHSTSHALNFSVDLIERSLAKHMHLLAIFIDFSKAFDTIDHKILLHKLWHYGIRGNAHSLLQDYLSKRTQYTNILNEESSKALVVYGVPQGSVLGPLLFLIYINDLIECSEQASFVLFADDTNIFVAGKTYDEAVEKANDILRCVSNYTRANKLHINIDKTCFMHFQPKRSTTTVTATDNTVLKLNGNEVEEVSETKFLGVTIDNQLSWEAHLNSLAKKLKCCSGQINRISNLIPQELYKSIYHTLFESHLSYGITVWGGVSLVKMRPIFIAQKRCVRILFGDRQAYLEKFKTSARARPIESQKLSQEFYEKEHTKPLFNGHNLFTVQNLYNYQVLNATCKILKLRTPIAIHSCFNISERKETLLHLPKNPSVSFFYNASSLWNKFLNCPEGHSVKSCLVELGCLKSKIKELVLRRQKLGDPNKWHENMNFVLHQ